jgi:predicted ATPase
MNEKIIIENFGGLADAEIDINAINIYIGRQASGKSVSAKLIYFFKNIYREIYNAASEYETRNEIDKRIISKFESYFPAEVWKNTAFKIKYKYGDDEISIEKNKKGRLELKFSKLGEILITGVLKFNSKFREAANTNYLQSPMRSLAYDELFFSEIKDNFGERFGNTQVFIPAGRSFFANLQSAIFSVLSSNKSIDPFLIEFGSFYERTKAIIERAKEERAPNGIDKIISNILGGVYLREGDKDYIIHSDKRKINVAFSSSGQQETLPLSIILKAIAKLSFSSVGITVYIEEPEAHLFPSAQKSIVELIATVYNLSNSKIQFVITTHSPYILTSFNNLFHAGLLIEQGKAERLVNKTVPKSQRLKPTELNAYEMRDGKAIDLIDKEYGLITAESLDKASEDISKQFSELLDIE